MKKLLSLCLTVLLTASLTTGCGKKEESDQTSGAGAGTQTETQKEAGTKAEEKDSANLHHVTIQVKDYGAITVELDSTYAPVSVENFLKLTKEGFYDGLTFHRIIKGFMIQGGDPEGTGMGGSDETITGEFSSNGVENPLSHTRGAISMARSQDKNSASSQFFIVHEDSPFLNGNYAVFGYVTDGMDVVDQICDSVSAVDNNGGVNKEDQPVIEKIEVID